MFESDFLAEFESSGQQLVQKIAAYLRDVSERRVSPAVGRDGCFAAFANTLGNEGIGLAETVAEVEKIFDHSMAMSHPLYLGLVNSSPFPAAALGDLLVSSLDNNSGATHQGPAAAAVEREIVRALSHRLNYPAEGMLLPGGSYANLHAVVMARDAHFPNWASEGPQSMSAAPRLYVAEGSHLSMARAATSAGLGQGSIVQIRAGGRGEMDAAALCRQIETDKADGHFPFLVLATAGSTGTGAIDPLDEIADICQQQRLWFHVDACYGGAVGLIDRLEHLTAGMHRADSVAIDLHKWLFMPLTVGLLLTRRSDVVRSVFRVAASYIPDDEYVEAYQRGIPTSRRSTSLAIWFAVRAYGWRPMLEAIERNIELTRQIEAELTRLGFRVMPGGQLSIACARWEPKTVDDAHWNSLQIGIARRICDDGGAWFATTRLGDDLWLRVNMVNLHTRDHHIPRLIELIRRSADAETKLLAATASTT